MRLREPSGEIGSHGRAPPRGNRSIDAHDEINPLLPAT